MAKVRGWYAMTPEAREQARQKMIATIKAKVARGEWKGHSGYQHSEESKEKMRVTHAGKNTLALQRYKDQNPDWRERISQGLKLNQERAIAFAERLRTEGYDVVILDRTFMPDLIARKRGKFYAVEIQGKQIPNYKKYNDVSLFDNVLWVYYGDAGKVDEKWFNPNKERRQPLTDEQQKVNKAKRDLERLRHWRQANPERYKAQTH